MTSVRLASAYAIGELGPNHPRALVALFGALKDPDDDVREEAAFAIGEIGTDAQPVLNALQQATQDSSPTVRDAAKEAIEKLEGDDDDDEPAAAKNAVPKGAIPKKKAGGLPRRKAQVP